LTDTVKYEEFFEDFAYFLIETGSIGFFWPISGIGESRDKAGQAWCATEVLSGYLKYSVPPKIPDICHQTQPKKMLI